MKTYRLEIDDDILDKVLWMLEHFKNDGVAIEKLDTDDIDIQESIKASLRELHQVKNGTIKPQLAREFLSEL